MTHGDRYPRLVGVRVGLVVAATMMSSVAGAQQLLDRVVARVGNHAITQSEVQAAIGFGLTRTDDQAAALDQLIDRYVALTELDRSGRLEPDVAAVDDALARMKSSAGGRLPAVMQTTGADESRLRQMARDSVRLQAYIDERFPLVAASEPDAQQYYKAHPDEFRRAGTVVPYAEAAADARAAVANDRRLYAHQSVDHQPARPDRGHTG